MKFMATQDEATVLEALEARIAPASIELSGGSITIPLPSHNAGGDVPAVTWESFSTFAIVSPSELWCRDVDGDGIIVKFDRDVLTSQTVTEAFAFEMGEFGTHLVSIDVTKLAANPKSLKGLDIDVSAISKTPLVSMPHEPVGPGDGLVNIDLINAAGIDLGKVSVEGNLGQIIAGDGKLGTAGLESLTVESLGLLDGGLSNSAALMSTITGSLKKLNVAHDINGAVLWVYGGKQADLLDAHVGGDIVGGDFDYSGSIYVDGTIKKAVLDGDLVGGSDIRAGLIHAENGIQSLTIGGNIAGGSAYGAGRVEGVGGIGAVEVRGGVHAGTDEYAGSIFSTKGIQSVTVGESLLGGDDRGSGSIFADTKIGKAVVHGDLQGGAGEGSGYLQAQKAISKLTVDGDLVGGAGLRSGSVATFDGKIGKIDHAGDEIAGTGVSSGTVIDFANKGVKKAHSSGSSTSGNNGGSYSTGYIESTSGVSLINLTGGSISPTYPVGDLYANNPTYGLSEAGLIKTGEGTLILAGVDYVVGTADFQDLVIYSNVPLNTDTIASSSLAGLEWPTDVVGARLKKG